MVSKTSPREEIRHLLASYCQRDDDRDFDGFGELFLSDAEFVEMGRTHVGAAAIREFMEGAQPPDRRGKHITSNTLISLDAAADVASISTHYLFVDTSLSVTSAGRYVDRVACSIGGAWRFARREIQFLGT